MRIDNDAYGRTVDVVTNEAKDIYTITDGDTIAFVLSYNTGKPVSQVYATINSMIPIRAIPVLTTLQSIQNAIANAQQFASNLMQQFAAENVLLGITQAGKTGAVLDYLSDLLNCMVTGSLFQAIIVCDTIINDTSNTKTNTSPFVTNARITAYKNKIQDYLGIAQT